MNEELEELHKAYVKAGGKLNLKTFERSYKANPSRFINDLNNSYPSLNANSLLVKKKASTPSSLGARVGLLASQSRQRSGNSGQGSSQRATSESSSASLSKAWSDYQNAGGKLDFNKFKYSHNVNPERFENDLKKNYSIDLSSYSESPKQTTQPTPTAPKANVAPKADANEPKASTQTSDRKDLTPEEPKITNGEYKLPLPIEGLRRRKYGGVDPQKNRRDRLFSVIDDARENALEKETINQPEAIVSSDNLSVGQPLKQQPLRLADTKDRVEADLKRIAPENAIEQEIAEVELSKLYGDSIYTNVSDDEIAAIKEKAKAFGKEIKNIEDYGLLDPTLFNDFTEDELKANYNLIIENAGKKTYIETKGSYEVVDGVLQRVDNVPVLNLGTVNQQEPAYRPATKVSLWLKENNEIGDAFNDINLEEFDSYIRENHQRLLEDRFYTQKLNSKRDQQKIFDGYLSWKSNRLRHDSDVLVSRFFLNGDKESYDKITEIRDENFALQELSSSIDKSLYTKRDALRDEWEQTFQTSLADIEKGDGSIGDYTNVYLLDPLAGTVNAVSPIPFSIGAGIFGLGAAGSRSISSAIDVDENNIVTDFFDGLVEKTNEISEFIKIPKNDRSFYNEIKYYDVMVDMDGTTMRLKEDANGTFTDPDGNIVQRPAMLPEPVETEEEYSFTGLVPEAAHQMALMYATLRTFGGGAIKQSVGMSLGFYNDSYEEGLAQTGDEKIAHAYAISSGAIETLFSKLNPDRKLFGMKGVKQQILESIVNATGDKIEAGLRAGRRFVANVTAENIEELATEGTMLGVNKAFNVVTDSDFSTTMEKHEALNIIALTTLSSGAPQLATSIRDYRERVRSQEHAIILNAYNDEAYASLKEILQSEDVKKGLGEDVVSILEGKLDKYRKYSSKTGDNLSPGQVEGIVPLLQKKEELEGKKSVADENFKEEIQEEINKVDEEIKSIKRRGINLNAKKGSELYTEEDSVDLQEIDVTQELDEISAKIDNGEITLEEQIEILTNEVNDYEDIGDTESANKNRALIDRLNESYKKDDSPIDPDAPSETTQETTETTQGQQYEFIVPQEIDDIVEKLSQEVELTEGEVDIVDNWADREKKKILDSNLDDDTKLDYMNAIDRFKLDVEYGTASTALQTIQAPTETQVTETQSTETQATETTETQSTEAQPTEVEPTETQATETTETQAETQEADIERRREEFPETQSDTRTPITQKLLDYVAEVYGIPKFTGDLTKGTYISWLHNTGDLGYEVSRLLNTPKRAFDLIAKYDAEAKATEAQATETQPEDTTVEVEPTQDDTSSAGASSGNQYGTSNYKQGVNQTTGRTSSRVLPDGTRITGRYKVVSSNDVVASHNEETFESSEGYPLNERGENINDRDYRTDRNAQAQVMMMGQNLDQRAIEDTPVTTSDGVVIDGNNRTMSRKLAAKNKRDQKYIDALKAEAEFYGIDPQAIDGISNPMLVFETDTALPYNTDTLKKFNLTEKKEKSQAGKAVEISKSLSDRAKRQIALVYEDAERPSDVTSNSKNARRLLDVLLGNGVIQSNEVPRYFDVDKGVMTKEGVALMESIALGSVFNEKTINTLSMQGMGNIRNKMLTALTQLINNSALENKYQLGEHLSKAIEVIYESKQLGLTLQDYIVQPDLFGEKLLPTLEEYGVILALNDSKFKNWMNDYNNLVGKPDMFKEGDDKTITRQDILDETARQRGDEQVISNLSNASQESTEANAQNEGQVRKEKVATKPPAEKPDKSRTPKARQERKSYKKQTRKIRDEKINKQINDDLDDLLKSLGGNINMGINPETSLKAIKLISSYTKAGVYKFTDIIEDLSERIGEITEDLFISIKAGYASYRETAPDFEYDKMDKNTRDYTYESFSQINDNEQDFINDVQERIASGEKLGIVQLRKIAEEMGLKLSDTDIQELTEFSIIQEAKRISQEQISNEDKFKQIVDLYEKQPTISMRSSERIDKQQYSTPIPMSFLAGMFVNNIAPNTVLEPSAGNGMMVFNVKTENVIANEIDDKRLENLEKQPFKQITKQDATRPFPFKVNAVVMNPPFGSKPARNHQGFKVGGLDEQMTLTALESLEDNGVAAIIIGGHTKYKENGTLASQKAFLSHLHNFYNVVDVISMDGSLYRKQGTTFPTRMILIAGRKKELVDHKLHDKVDFAPNQKDVNTEVVNDFNQLFDRVNDAIKKTNDEKILQQPTAAANTVQRGKETETDRGTRNNTGTQETDVSGNQGERGRVLRSRGTSTNTVETDRSRRPDSGDTRDGSVADTDARAGRGESEGVQERVRDTDVSRVGVRDERLDREQIEVDITKEKVPYPKQSKSKEIGSVVPSSMAQPLNRALSIFEDIDQYVQTRLGYKTKQEMYKHLSAEQVDGVALAIYQIEQGKGLIIGDMTGVGKGRQAAALIQYAIQQGVKPVFVTEKAKLFSDFHRDLVDIGFGNYKPLIINNKSQGINPNIYDKNGKLVHKTLSSSQKNKIYDSRKIPTEFDYVIMTYSQISGKGGSSKKTFIANAMKGNIVVMDESHNAGGANSNTGLFFQSILPETKGVAFLSGTFAKKPENMPLYALKTAMAESNMSQEELIDAIQMGGVPLQEIMSRNLVEEGQMVRRERDFTGVTIDWEVMDDQKETQEKLFDEVIGVFNEMIEFQKEHVDTLVEVMDAQMQNEQGSVAKTMGTNNMGVSNSPFASRTFNLVRQLIFSLKADTIAEQAIAELKQGRKPVIAFESTMEAIIKDIGNQGDVFESDSYAYALKRAMDTVMKYTVTNYAGDKETNTYSKEDLTEEGRKRYDEIFAKIDDLSEGISMSPLDVIISKIEAAGYSVGEMTGRKNKLEKGTGGTVRIAANKKPDAQLLTRKFNNGELDVMMLNQSGSTGISLHASENFKDQRQRVMISAQTQLNVNTEVQMRGRIDRTGQTKRGAYRYIISPIPAEQRLIMMFKSKLKSLDANTTSSQKSKTNEIQVVDFLNKYGDQVVGQYLLDNPEINDKMLNPLKLVDGQEASDTIPENIASKASGRAALLTIKEQESFYKEVSEQYEALIKYLDQNGANDLEITTMPLNAETKSEMVVVQGSNNGSVFSQDSIREEVEVDVLSKPLTSDEVKRELEETLKGKTPYEYRQKLRDDLEKFVEDKNSEDEKAIMRKNLPKTIMAYINRQASEYDSEEQRNAFKEKEISEQKKSRVNYAKQKNREKVEGINKAFGMFGVGTFYLIPNDVEVGLTTTYSNGVFLGYKMGNKMTPSSITAVFATLDSRRKVEVPLSKMPYLNSIYAETNRSRPDVTLEKWDDLTPKKNRKTSYIITGNILQAYSTNKGKLINYTTKDGRIKDGILLPDNYNPDTQKMKVPITSKQQDILNGERVVDTTGEVVISTQRGSYQISVPKSKAKGGKYFLNDDLRALVTGQNFTQLGNDMVAEIPTHNVEKVLQHLKGKHNTSVFSDPTQLDKAEGERSQGDETHFSASNSERDSFNGRSNKSATLESIQKKYPDAVVVQSESDLPKEIRDEKKRRGIEGDIDGVLHNGKVYMVADAIPDMGTADGIYRHETLGHKGVISYLGEKINDYAMNIVDRAKGKQLKALQDIAKRYGLPTDLKQLTPEQKSTLGQEYIAKISENRSGNPTAWNNLVKMIREALRDLGINLRVSDTEIQALIGMVEKAKIESDSNVVTDLSGNQTEVDSSSIVTYESEAGPIHYIVDSNGDMQMVRLGEQTIPQGAQAFGTSDPVIYFAMEYASESELLRDTNGNVIGVRPEVLEEIRKEREQIETEARANGTWMKAPNGKNTNLNEAQWIDVRTKRFKNLFGDWINDPQNATKVLDENGEPMVVYHGTDANFNEFEPNYAPGWGEGVYFTNNKKQAVEEFGSKYKEVFLNIRKPIDDNQIPYEELSKTKYFDEIAIKEWNKLSESDKDGDWDNSYDNFKKNNFSDIDFIHLSSDPDTGGADLINNSARELGYDGIIADGSNNIEGLEIVAFEANQIKSATSNVGTFSNESNNINFSISQANDISDTARRIAAKENIWQRLKKAANRQINNTVNTKLGFNKRDAGAILGIKDAKRSFDANIAAAEAMIDADMINLHRTVGRDIKGTKNQRRAKSRIVNRYLAGETSTKPSFLSKASIAVLDELRLKLDINSDKIILQLDESINQLNEALDEATNKVQRGAIQQSLDKVSALKETIIDSKGKYLNRSYRIFSDPNYKPSERVVQRAIDYFVDNGMSVEDAEVTVNRIIEDAKDSNPVDFAQSMSGSTSNNILKRRKTLDDSILDLLGVYDDPIYNYGNTAIQQAKLIVAYEYQKNFREMLVSTGVASPVDRVGLVKAFPDSKGWSILNDLFVSPEIADFISDQNHTTLFIGTDDNFYNSFVVLTQKVKLMKTAYSVSTAMRNFFSGAIMLASTGQVTINPRTIREAAILAWKDNPKDRKEYMEKLIKLNILRDGGMSGELQRVLRDTRRGKGEFSEGRLARHTRAGAVANLPLRFYRFGDDFYKVIGFEVEKKTLMGYGMTEAQAEKEAARRITMTYPTYSHTTVNIKRLRTIPWIGTFVSFPAEIMRTTINNISIGHMDIKEGRTALGVKRLIGTYAVANILPVALALMSRIDLMDDEEEKSFRKFFPEWSQNSLIYYTKLRDNEVEMLDLSAFFPMATYQKPITAGLRGIDDKEYNRAAFEMSWELLSPYIGVDITADGIWNAMNNDNGFGGKIAKSEEFGEKIVAYSDFIARKMGPGTYGNLKELLQANGLIGEKSTVYGKEYTTETALLGLAGIRMQTTNLKSAIAFNSGKIQNENSMFRGNIKRQLRTTSDLSDENIKKLAERYVNVNKEFYDEMLGFIAAGRKARMSEKDIMFALNNSGRGIGMQDVGALMSGINPYKNGFNKADINKEIKTIHNNQMSVEDRNEYIEKVLKRFSKFNNYISEFHEF